LIFRLAVYNSKIATRTPGRGLSGFSFGFLFLSWNCKIKSVILCPVGGTLKPFQENFHLGKCHDEEHCADSSSSSSLFYCSQK
jgi:hypothetical protein